MPIIDLTLWNKQKIKKEHKYSTKEFRGKDKFERYTIYPDGRIYSNITNKFLKPFITANGYLQIRCGNSFVYVHRLVAEKYIPNPNNLPQINHKNEDKTDNRVENLEWCDSKYNTRYSKAKKIYCYNKDGELVKIYNTSTDTKLDGFNDGSVRNVCAGRKYTHHGYTFSYEELTKEQVKFRFL